MTNEILNTIEVQIGCALIGVLLFGVVHNRKGLKVALSIVTALLRILLAGPISITGLFDSDSQS